MSGARIAAVYPGQGSQRPGMGKDFYEEISVCRLTYEESSDVLGFNVAALCFSDDERLNQTVYTQPCILATEIAMHRGLEERYDFSPGFFGGHSLGEYTALVAAGVIPLAAALIIVQERGRLMQTAMPLGTGAMSAVISPQLNVPAIKKAINDLPIDIVNVNSKEQIVISGLASSMPDAEARIREALAAEGACRIVALNVSAPFHSRFMKPIEEPFSQVLQSHKNSMSPHLASRVTSNYNGAFHSAQAEELLASLVSQLSNAVRWKDNMETLAASAREIYEIGPSRPLKGFFGSIAVECGAITSLSAADKILGKKQ